VESKQVKRKAGKRGMVKKNQYAVIAGDLIHSRRMKREQKAVLYADVAKLLALKEDLCIIEGEISRGDFVQCLLDKPEEALRCMLIIMMFLKHWPIDEEKAEPVQIRMGLGIGTVEFISDKLAISDGEAFQTAGHLLDELKKSASQRLAVGIDAKEKDAISAVFLLLDACLRKTTAVQAKAVYYKLMGKTQVEIAGLMKMNQSAVSRHLAATHWNAIDHTLKYYKQTMLSLNS
jgi:hypothetical protein